MRFKEADQCGEKHRIAGPAAKLVCPDSGQVDEPLCPPRITKRYSQCSECEGVRIGWRIGGQGLTFEKRASGDKNWRRS